jgi:hypothetical protein
MCELKGKFIRKLENPVAIRFFALRKEIYEDKIDTRNFNSCKRLFAGLSGLTLAFAPRSSAETKLVDGNRSFMALIRLSGSLAFLSSSSKTNK